MKTVAIVSGLLALPYVLGLVPRGNFLVALYSAVAAAWCLVTSVILITVRPRREGR